MKFLIVFAIFMTLAWARPQRFPVQQLPDPNNPFFPVNNNGPVSIFPIQQVPGPGNNGVVQTTTVTPGTATTASPQFLACMQSCPSTMEYNPVCGTDNENYHNNGRLSCAQRCGKDVAALRLGTCQPL